VTDAPASAARSESASFPQLWADSLGQVLSQIGGSALSCLVTDRAPENAGAVHETDLWIVGACTGGLRGEMSLRLSAATTLSLAQMFTSEPATPEAPVTAEHREGTLELLRQVAGLVQSALKARWGETPVRLEAVAGAPSWPASSSSWLRFGDQNSPWLIELQLSAALAAALRAEKTEAAKPASTLVQTAAPPTEENRGKLDLLMDVELAVTLRFGAKRLLLREILDLNPGSVIELDRQVQEPVDMLLDGRLVARGEVVVINGEYGLRITEIGSQPS
jgi:flagellar motor switch protein FliN/FliY